MRIVPTAAAGADWTINVHQLGSLGGYTATIHDARGYAVTTVAGWSYNGTLRRAHRWIDTREAGRA